MVDLYLMYTVVELLDIVVCEHGLITTGVSLRVVTRHSLGFEVNRHHHVIRVIELRHLLETCQVCVAIDVDVAVGVVARLKNLANINDIGLSDVRARTAKLIEVVSGRVELAVIDG